MIGLTSPLVRFQLRCRLLGGRQQTWSPKCSLSLSARYDGVQLLEDESDARTNATKCSTYMGV